MHAFPFTRPANDRRWADLEAAIGSDLLARLEWQQGGDVQLSDFEAICRAADDDAERILVSEALSRMTATMAWLTLRADDPIEPLIAYWGRGARTRDLRPILDALARVPGGGILDVVHLLPPFARRRLNTFPQPGDPPRNCFWSALHFFDINAPVDEVISPEAFVAVLSRDYDPVAWDSRTFGDVIAFVDRHGLPIPAANHVAGELAFTKNGYHERRPWTLQTVAAIRDTYVETADLRAFRLRQLPNR